MMLPPTPERMLAIDPGTEPARLLLAVERDRAERLLNKVRGAAVLLLGLAALAYAPRLPSALNTVNLYLFLPMMAWTVLQGVLFRSRAMLPQWLLVLNPAIDITAVTASIIGYGIVQSPALALKSPMFLAYFAILAARPIASSTRHAVFAALLVPVAYAFALIVLLARTPLELATSPITASLGPAVSPLDEGAKLLFLAMAGAIATYATEWHERLAVRYFQQAHDHERTELRLMQARLESLKGQLQPHFLFNTLNTILALIRPDPATAERMVSGLSALLRASLDSGGSHVVPLERELAILGAYLDIQQVRFRNRLDVHMEIDQAARSVLVPHLLLQPLVENAIKHGISPRSSAGRVDVRAACDDGQLCIEVRDDGVGPPLHTNGGVREGVGLSNTRARLRHLYGDEHQFSAGRGPSGGFVVTIAIPVRHVTSELAAAGST